MVNKGSQRDQKNRRFALVFRPLLAALALMEKRTMTLETTGIDHVNLQVNNLEESFRFWERLLGFVILEDISSQQGMIIGNRAAKLALYENAELWRVKWKIQMVTKLS